MRSPASEALERRAGLAVVITFGLLCVCVSGQFPPLANPNEASRYAAVFAFVESGTFQVDDALRVIGDTEDKSISGGHFYSNKAPGLALAAIPVYRALRAVLPRPASPFAPIWVWLRVLVVSTVCCVAFDRLRARLDASGREGSTLVVAALAFGTPLLFFGRSFFSHAWTAALLFLSLELIRKGERASATRRVGFPLWSAGALAGWAAISEYPVAILAALLLARSASRRAWRNGVTFALGLALPLGALLAYDAICFGSPFVLSSAREAFPEYSQLSGRGLLGLGLPDPRVAVALLFQPARGLFLFSPFLAWAVPGFVRWRRRREERSDWTFCLAASILYFAVICAYPNWHGGWSLGDRYLLPILFPLALAASHALDSPRSRSLFAAAAAFSIACYGLAALAWPYFPLSLSWFPRNGSLWFLQRGWAAPALPGIPAALALVAGIAGALVALAACAAGEGRRGRRSILAAAAGLLVFAAVMAVAPPPSPDGQRFRAGILARALPDRIPPASVPGR